MKKQFRGIHADKSIRHFETMANPIHDENGNAIGLEGTIQDISKRVRAAAEKQDLEQQLRQSQKLETIGTLTGGIAHEFNNVLMPIAVNAELSMLEINESHPVHGYLKEIFQASERAKTLVDQIMLFSRQTRQDYKAVDLTLQIEQALAIIRPQLPPSVKISQEIDINCNKVWGDGLQLRQVILNLCTNAWQAMEEKGGILQIELAPAKADAALLSHLPNLHVSEYTCLRIQDNGTGINESALKHIFEPFYSTKDVNKGTGLGLSVVHGIITEHRGCILVNTKPGLETSFQIYLPISADDGRSIASAL